MINSITKNLLQITTRNKQIRNMTSLKFVLEKLEEFAPIAAAEPWDNVGLLIEPSKAKNIQKIFLTNDLTEAVMDEALEKNSDLIISYHPPIFSALKRITNGTWKERIVQKCLENRIALFAPHTSWDNIDNGINDWLASAFPSVQSSEAGPNGGKVVTLEGISLTDAIARIKNHVGVDDCRVGIAVDGGRCSIKTIAICAGSGTSVLKGIKADLYLTGEMFHHDVLDANHQNTSVILLNHTNSERGFLKVFRNVFSKSLNDPSIEILISETDADPLRTL